MLKSICLHWTAGAYNQSEDDYRHYHYTIGKDGIITGGKFRPEANIGPLRNGQYAAHCGGGNSYCIGVAMRGMAGYTGPANVGKYPITAQQAEATWSFLAKLCKDYKIPVTPDTVFTHYEFGKKHPNTSSAGKIDIVHLPHKPELKPDEIGDYIRGKVKWYLVKLEGKERV